ncbi:thiamine pyrophosphate-binding protein [Methanocaldococcus indicus]|uniref:thiamine pyrophosphate-binding protein n=1 Tax=Methanocaldococcus indicus TaxID=213231 RepID=UPI003C6D6E45
MVIIKFYEAISNFLKEYKVFCYPGEQIYKLYESLENKILVGDERGAGFMAEGYSRINNIGFCLVTNGPGISNLATPLANAYKDNTSILAISGRTERKYINKNYFQEIEIKTNAKQYFFDTPDFNKFLDAYNYSLRNKKPSLLNIPADVFEEDCIFLDEMDIDYSQNIDNIINKINSIKAEKPLILIGQGIFGNLSYEEILKIPKILNKLSLPISTTYPARGVIDESKNIGLVGRRGDISSLLNSDKILNIGSSLSYNTYPPSIREKLLKKTININFTPNNLEEIKYLFENISLESSLEYEKKFFSPKGDYSQKINEIIKYGDIIVTDAGKHTVFTSLLKICKEPKTLISSHSFGCMGFGLPVGIGVKFALIDKNIDKEVLVISGDGGILMNIEELKVISDYNLDIKVVVMKNNKLANFTKIKNPNFIKIAEGFGLETVYIEDIEDIKELKYKKQIFAVVEVEDEELPKPNL